MKRYLGILVFAVSAFGQSIPSGVRIPATARIPAGVVSSGRGGYAHYVAITTASGQEGSSDSSGFPVMVNTSTLSIATNLAAPGSGGYVQNTVTQTGGNGGMEPADAVFGTTSDCSTLLPWETETYTATTGAWIVWVQLPTLHHSAQDTFYLCFDAVSVTTQQNTGSYAPSAVWDTYSQAVFHLAETTVTNGSTLHDSTANGNNATVVTTSYSAATGEIDGGINLGASAGGAYASLGGTITQSGARTHSFWTQGQSSYPGNVSAGNGSHYSAYLASGTVYASNASGYIAATLNTITSGAWYHIAVTVDSSGNYTFYQNGSSIGTGSLTGGTTVTTLFNLGASLAYSTGGVNDEFRFESTNRSASWVAAEYNNQKPSSTFLTAGSLH